MDDETTVAAVAVPVDPRAFREALLLVQPTWIRASATLAVFAAAGIVAWRMPDVSMPLLFVVAAALSGALFAVRARAARAQVDAWVKDGGAGGVVHVALTETGFRRGGALTPWADVTHAAEVDTAQGLAFLALRARGVWTIVPAPHFVEGTFAGARAFVMQRRNGDVRAVIV